MHLLRLLVPLLATLAACTAPIWTGPASPGAVLPGSIHVCLDLPKAHIPAAVRAVELWDKSLGNWKRVHADADYSWTSTLGCTVVVHETTRSHPTVDNALAWARMGGEVVWMKKGRYEMDVTGILLHELGHIFGADHVPGTLMNAAWEPNTYLCPDRLTVMQVAAWQHADLNLMSWCR